MTALRVHTHTHTDIHTLSPPKPPPLTKTSPTFLLIGLGVKGENGWGGLWGGGEGVGGVNVTFFFPREIPKTQWGGLVSVGLLTKEPQFVSVRTVPEFYSDYSARRSTK